MMLCDLISTVRYVVILSVSDFGFVEGLVRS